MKTQSSIVQNSSRSSIFGLIKKMSFLYWQILKKYKQIVKKVLFFHTVEKLMDLFFLKGSKVPKNVWHDLDMKLFKASNFWSDLLISQKWFLKIKKIYKKKQFFWQKFCFWKILQKLRLQFHLKCWKKFLIFWTKIFKN